MYWSLPYHWTHWDKVETFVCSQWIHLKPCKNRALLWKQSKPLVRLKLEHLFVCLLLNWAPPTIDQSNCMANVRHPNSAGCWANIRGIVEDVLTFHLVFQQGWSWSKATRPLWRCRRCPDLWILCSLRTLCVTSRCWRADVLRTSSSVSITCHIAVRFLCWSATNVWGTVMCRKS